MHTQVYDKIVDNMLDVDVHQKLTTKLAAACSYRLAQIATEMVGKGFYQSNFSLPTMLSQQLYPLVYLKYLVLAPYGFLLNQ